MYNFLVQSYSTYKGLYYWLNWSGYVSGVVLYPFAMGIMFSILGRITSSPDVILGYALGITVLSIAHTLITGITQAYQYDRTLGTISFLFISPANRLANFLSRAVLHGPNALLALLFGLLAAWGILGLDFGMVNWAGFVLAVIAIAFTLSGFAQLLGIISITIRDFIGVVGLANGLLMILTGVIIPVTVFPDFIEEFAKLLPITNGLFAAKDTFTGAQLSAVSDNILREAITGLVYYVIAFAGFRIFEYITRQKGTLDRDAL